MKTLIHRFFIPLLGSVALHEAAENGSLDAIKVLLSFRAPSCPQNKRRELPSSLAKKNGHMECYKLLSTVIVY